VYGHTGAVTHHHRARWTHELIAGAAAFEAMRLYEQRRAQDGYHDHALAREMLAALVGVEIDRLFETKGLDWLDRERVRYHAHQSTSNMYQAQYGNSQPSGGFWQSGGGTGFLGGLAGGGIMGTMMNLMQGGGGNTGGQWGGGLGGLGGGGYGVGGGYGNTAGFGGYPQYGGNFGVPMTMGAGGGGLGAFGAQGFGGLGMQGYGGGFAGSGFGQPGYVGMPPAMGGGQIMGGSYFAGPGPLC